MTKMLRIAVTALALGTIALPVIAEDKASDPIAAKANGVEIHYSEVTREARNLGPQAQQVPPQVLYPQLIERMVLTKLIAKLGYDQKVQNDAEVKTRLKEAEEQIVADVYVRKTVEPKISEDKIKAKYDQLVAKFTPQEEVRASHILVKTETEANDILKQIKGGADFAKLAEEKSTDTGSAKKGGDLDYFDKTAMVKPFAEAAFNMKVGEVSDKAVKTDFGYHIIKLVDRRKSSAPKLEAVKAQISNQVGQELTEELVKGIEAKSKIERFNPDGSAMKSPAEAKKEDAAAKK